MARVKRGVTAHARHKKVLAKTKGYYNARGNVYRAAKQQAIKSAQYAYRDRRTRKRVFRSLWIARINAGARMFGTTYSRMIEGLTKANIQIDRKMLSELAVRDIQAFGKVCEQAKAHSTAA